MKVEVQNRGAKYTNSKETQLFHQRIEDLRNRSKQRSHETDKLISELKNEGIEILNSQLDRQTVTDWIWCHSLDNVQKQYESNKLRDILLRLANIGSPASKIIQSKMMNIDGNQFKKTGSKSCALKTKYNQHKP